jgi:hypothetical protein
LAELDEDLVEWKPVLPVYYPRQFLFCLFRSLRFDQAYAIEDPVHVCVYWNRGSFEAVDEYAVCGFTADRGKLEQLFHLVWDFAFVFLQDYPRDSFDVPGLGVVEADRLDESGDGSRICASELSWAGILGKEAG